jgi:hypothetical protein
MFVRTKPNKHSTKKENKCIQSNTGQKAINLQRSHNGDTFFSPTVEKGPTKI